MASRRSPTVPLQTSPCTTEGLMMYAVVTQQAIDPTRSDEVARNLHDKVVPAQRSLPGCSEVVHLRSQDGRNGIVIMILDTPEHAERAAATITTPQGAPVIIQSTTVYEVSAHA
jgi:hypothetical protein